VRRQEIFGRLISSGLGQACTTMGHTKFLRNDEFFECIRLLTR